MAKDILIISGQTGFMLNSLIKGLSGLGLEAEVIKPSELSGCTDIGGDKPSLFVVYGGEYLSADESFLPCLKELCERRKKTVCAAGSREEIDLIKMVLPPFFICCELEAPFSAADLTERIRKIVKTNGSSKKKSILLVDDDIMFLKMTMKWMSEYFEVSLAKSGAQVISYLSSKTPDLIMLDYNMPDMSGAQVMQEIRSKAPCPDVPIMFLTGRTDKDTIEEVMALKPQGYIPKASAQSEILKAINDLFEKQAQVK